MRVRGMLLAAIAYFILPFDFLPDVIAGLGSPTTQLCSPAIACASSRRISRRPTAARSRRGAGQRLPETT